MTLWTIQPEEIYHSILQTGQYICDPLKFSIGSVCCMFYGCRFFNNSARLFMISLIPLVDRVIATIEMTITAIIKKSIIAVPCPICVYLREEM